MTIKPLVFLTSAALFAAGAAFAQDAAELTAGCVDCHGEAGAATVPGMPVLGGQSDIVVSDWIYAFQDELRPCDDLTYPEGAGKDGGFNHCTHFADWSDDDMMVVGEYYAEQDFVAPAQEADPALVSTGQGLHEERCEKCHTDNGANVDDDAGLLAGQWIDYLEKTMGDYLAGSREMPKKMAEKMEGLSDADVKALAHFYGSQGG